jgi:hypothetical protein
MCVSSDLALNVSAIAIFRCYTLVLSLNYRAVMLYLILSLIMRMLYLSKIVNIKYLLLRVQQDAEVQQKKFTLTNILHAITGIFGLCPTSGFLKNTTVRKQIQFPERYVL